MNNEGDRHMNTPPPTAIPVAPSWHRSHELRLVLRALAFTFALAAFLLFIHAITLIADIRGDASRRSSNLLYRMPGYPNLTDEQSIAWLKWARAIDATADQRVSACWAWTVPLVLVCLIGCAALAVAARLTGQRPPTAILCQPEKAIPLRRLG
jgi:hypothetical protein